MKPRKITKAKKVKTNEAKAKTKAKIKAKAKAVEKKHSNHIVITESDSKKASWYVVHTYSGHEIKVAEQLKQRVKALGLEEYILEILIPTQEKIEIRSGAKQKIQEKIFPGYMLVRMILTDNSWIAVRTTNGITGFVGIGDRPTPLKDKEVEAIQKFMDMAAPKFKTKFSMGEAVKIIEGPFADFLGTIDNIDETKGKVKVLVSIFGRETPVELDFLQVAKI